jgi:RraA family protein
MKIGYRIKKDIERPSPELIKAFEGIPSSNIGDMMGRLYCSDSTLYSLNGKPLLGPAFTVKAPGGDNLAFHLALDLAQPGDILVIDGQRNMERAMAGELMVNYAIKRKLGGIIVNGCMRDVDAIKEMDLPVYCCGVTPVGPYKFGPGEINVPVVAGGQAILPGDIIVGDVDGIVVIRKEDATAVVAEARAKFEAEAKSLEAYHSDGPYDFSKHINQYKKASEQFEMI